MEDLSDQQMEAASQKNNAMKFFYVYELMDKMPDWFGTEGMEFIFKNVNLL